MPAAAPLIAAARTKLAGAGARLSSFTSGAFAMSAEQSRYLPPLNARSPINDVASLAKGTVNPDMI